MEHPSFVYQDEMTAEQVTISHQAGGELERPLFKRPIEEIRQQAADEIS